MGSKFGKVTKKGVWWIFIYFGNLSEVLILYIIKSLNYKPHQTSCYTGQPLHNAQAEKGGFSFQLETRKLADVSHVD